MDFYSLPPGLREKQVSRIMISALNTFNHTVTAEKYMRLYEKMLDRPLLAGNE